jgi:ABC-type phosphate/phosphonate transport system permease subunit
MGISPRNHSWIVVMLGALMLLSAGAAWAQVDVPAAVAGRREGMTEVMSPRFPPTRVLVVKNLRLDTAGADAAKWKGDVSTEPRPTRWAESISP